MSILPDMNLIPQEVLRAQMRNILLAIPPRAGMACTDPDLWAEEQARLSRLVEAALLAQRELYEFEKEGRRGGAGRGAAQ